MDTYVLNKKSKWQIITMDIVKSVLFALVLTVLISLLFGYRYLNVISGSMEPNIPKGSLITIIHKPASDFKVGDVATFNTNGVLCTHRIIKIDNVNKKITTKGDANRETVELVDFNKVEGIVVAHCPYLGYVLDFIRDNIIGVLVCCVVVILVLKLV